MALDGIFLSCINSEISLAIGSKVENIYQISSLEIVLLLRLPQAIKKLLISANSASCRVNFTRLSFDNPKNPPSFCMLLRKHLKGARLVSSSQIGLDRIINLEFEGKDEVYNTVFFILAVEIMGKHSNIVLYDKKTRLIVGAIKNVDFEKSRLRRVLPKIKYVYPPFQKKFNILNVDLTKIMDSVFEKATLSLPEALVATIAGISSSVAKEIAFEFKDVKLAEFSKQDRVKLFGRLFKFLNIVSEKNFEFLIFVEDCVVKDFSFFDFLKYDSMVTRKKFSSPSQLLDFYFEEKAMLTRVAQRSFDVVKFLNFKINKAKDILKIRLDEEKAAITKNNYNQYGDLLSANFSKIKKGQKEIEVLNFYDSDKPIKLKLDPVKTPAENLQSYYRLYEKYKKASLQLKILIEKSLTEIEFFENKLKMLQNASTEDEINDIVAELDYDFSSKFAGNCGFKAAKKTFFSDFLTFQSSDGFKILCGRTARQNEKLSLKIAKKDDFWFHIKYLAGSHVIVFTNGKSLPERTIYEAAVIAACNSKARFDNRADVIYTQVRNLKKLKGTKVGNIIYRLEKTISVVSDLELIGKLKVV